MGTTENDTLFPKEKQDSIQLYNYYQYREYARAKIKKNEFVIYSQDYNIKSFDWQLTSEKILFVVVILISLCGIVFSGIQFYNSMLVHRYYFRMKKDNIKTPKKEKPDELNATTDTQITIGVDGLEIKSSIIGVIILVISIVFFYLYLHFVYPIT
ncbi:MAG: hypothetical protein ACXVPN_15410 [Bacteroidia bacterium]